MSNLTQNTWTTKRLKYLATINDEALPENTDPDLEISYVDIGNVDSTGISEAPTTYRFENAPSRARRIVKHGDVIISTVRTYLQAIAPIENPPKNLIVSTGFAVVRPISNELDMGFCKYVLRENSFLSEVEKRSVGVSYPAINSSELGDIFIKIAPLPTQRRIAAYLDRETAHIDTLIAAKERLLLLMAEKRQALIARAVTRGLDETVKLKDSGVAWLGEVPEGWEIEKLKYHTTKIEQGWSPNCDNFPASEDEWGVLKAGCVNGWELNEKENKRLPETLEIIHEYEIHTGDILMSRANTRQLLGSVVLIKNVRPKLLLCDKLYRISVNTNQVEKEFLVYFLRSIIGRFQLEREATGASSSMQNIGQETVINTTILRPPIEEQKSIVHFLNATIERLNTIEAATKRTIELLKERRSALIAAAVTGQIQIT